MECLAEQRSTLEAELKLAEEKTQTVAWMRDRSLALFHHRKDLEKWWMESCTKSERHRLLRALIDPDRGGRIFVFPPPPDHVPDPILFDFWGGRVKCRFKFDPDRLIEALEALGVMERSRAEQGGGKRGGSKKVAPEDLGQHDWLSRQGSSYDRRDGEDTLTRFGRLPQAERAAPCIDRQVYLHTILGHSSGSTPTPVEQSCRDAPTDEPARRS
ncbi:MAG: hypothetical protein V3R42_05430 [candidate division NC10 bacterium]